MKFLFLDDDWTRLNKIRSLIPSVVLAQSSQEAIDLLQGKEWDLVSLDHDLGGQVMVDSSREDTGMEVVRWIVENKPKIKWIIIHTFNPVGAKNMVHDLKNADYKVIYARFDPTHYITHEAIFHSKSN